MRFPIDTCVIKGNIEQADDLVRVVIKETIAGDGGTVCIKVNGV